ncbi:MAG: hypothetical protein KA807_16320, partial [Prolixibacteraceae bacterium]|nr:hypothetical protein [Prolixibacteraceae bacterium]
FVRKPLTAKFIQYDGSDEMRDWLNAEYAGVYVDGGCLFFSDADEAFPEILEDDWLHIAGGIIIDVIAPLKFKEMYEEVK